MNSVQLPRRRFRLQDAVFQDDDSGFEIHKGKGRCIFQVDVHVHLHRSSSGLVASEPIEIVDVHAPLHQSSSGLVSSEPIEIVDLKHKACVGNTRLEHGEVLIFFTDDNHNIILESSLNWFITIQHLLSLVFPTVVILWVNKGARVVSIDAISLSCDSNSVELVREILVQDDGRNVLGLPHCGSGLLPRLRIVLDEKFNLDE
ncbi:hypothetical protein L6452_20954 [Arctium lappa]|uniref:Uncharacterized protein n=1 Tax=Arctium lappa TaxID=4217 RepID=A0ACB9BCB8_ARCLA|nr:hypothetical protein L6452_20954 [Arctium lappa]